MINNVETGKLEELLMDLKGKKVAVLGHEAPDGDCIGSTLGMGSLLRSIGAHPLLMNKDEVPSQYKFLGDETLCVQVYDKMLMQDIEAIIVVDCAKELRIGVDVKSVKVPVINIDHHVSNEGFGDFNYVLEAGATAEIITSLALDCVGTIDVVGATALYTGIMTDTGNLTYESTTVATLRLAATLLELGADMNRMRQEVYENTPLAQLKALEVVLEHLDVCCEGEVAYTYLTHEELSSMKLKNGDLDGFVNYPRQVNTSEVALFFKEVEAGVVKVSVRTKKTIDANKLASAFGGGGHKRAAGFRKTDTMEVVLEWALKKIEEGLAADEWIC